MDPKSNNIDLEEKYRLILENANDLITIFDLDFNYEYFNERQYYETLGYKFEDLKGSKGIDIVHPDEKETIMEDFKRIPIRKKVSVQVRLRHKKGHYIWTETSGSIFTDQNGQEKILTITRDITDRKRAEAKITESEENYRTLVDNLPHKIFLKDINSVYISCNSNFANDVNLTVDKIPGKNDYDLYSKNIAEKYRAEDKEIIRLNETRDLEEEFLIDGKEFCFKKIIMPVHDELGKVTGILGVIMDITKQKLMEKKLEIERNLYRDTIDGLPGIFYLYDEGGTMKFWNKAVEKISGYSHKEIKRFNAIDFFDTDDQPLVLEAVKKNLIEGEADVEANLFTKDKRKIPYFFHGKRILINNEPNAVGLGIDISKRRKAEEQLKESEKKYRLLANNLNDIIWTMDLNFNTTYVSPSRETILGFTVEEDKAIPFKEKFTSDSIKKIVKIIAQLINQKNINDPDFNPVLTLEVDQYHKDGSIVPTEVKVNPMRDKDGIAIGLVGITRDITERKKARKQLELSERLYRNLSQELELILDNLPASVLYKDIEGNVINVNQFFADALSKNKEELIGRNIKDFFPKIQADRIINSDQQIIHTKKRIEYIDSYMSENGLRWGLTIKLPLFDENNEVTGILSVTQEISKIKQAEQKLKESESKYREAYDRAEFYKDLFVHDINNILQGIILSSQISQTLVKKGKCGDKLEHLLVQIGQSVERGTKLVKNVRKISALENQKQELTKLEIISLLKETISFLGGAFQDKTINFTLDSPKDEIHIMGNNLIQDVFENLIINAIKHNRNDSIEINIKISEERDADTPTIRFEFIDNGVGIEDKRKELVFLRGYGMRDKNTQGMGLGLSIVYKIVTLFNGKIWIEDRVRGNISKGSKFIILLPLVEK